MSPTTVFPVTAPFFVPGSPRSCRVLPPRVAQIAVRIAVMPLDAPRGQRGRARPDAALPRFMRETLAPGIGIDGQVG